MDVSKPPRLESILENPVVNPKLHRLPEWFNDISQKAVEKEKENTIKKGNKITSFYIVNPVRPLTGKNYLEHSAMEAGYSKPSSRRNYKRTSFSAEVYDRFNPKNIDLNKSNYLVPKADGRFDFKVFEEDARKQSYLEKSWQSLNSFRQTHKGRLDKHVNDYSKNKSTVRSSTSKTAYTPTILENGESNIHTKRGKSSCVPFYVYANIKKVTEPNSSLNLSYCDSDSFQYTSKSKSKSSDDIHKPEVKDKDYIYNLLDFKHFQNSTSSENSLERLFNQPSINKKLDEYKQRVSTNIEGILTLSGRISARLREESRSKLQKTESSQDGKADDIFSQIKPKRKSIHSIPNQTSKSFCDNTSDEYINFDRDKSPFVIPQLPTGRVLKINILSTWGDKHYVGLNGIEIFGSDGRIAEVKQIRAFPPDVNILPENNNDPRVVENLLDGINRTQDDVHLWLAPFDVGSKHEIIIEFTSVITIAMIRIWNYNKSRIHSYRGVREIEMTLDSIPIFKGEIAKACGGILGGVDAFGDTILFTIDDHILELVSRNDRSFSSLIGGSPEETEAQFNCRPPTVALMDDRPITGASHTKSVNTQTPETSKDSNEKILLGTNQLDLILLSNWGYPHLIGLTGLEILGASDEPLDLSVKNLKCSFKSKPELLERLINGENLTTDSKNMWSAPFVGKSDGIILSIIFDELVYVSGIRIWNYNENLQMTYAGVQNMKIILDNKPLTNRMIDNHIFLLRRAPGNVHYDFVQEISFSGNEIKVEDQESLSPVFIPLSVTSSILYESPSMPEGFVYQIIIFSTWGDQYYCGLNGIQFYNDKGKKIPLDESNICAYPESVNVLEGISGDVRTPDKLIDGENDDSTGTHSWLAPIIPKCLNRIYVVLDEPITVSVIKVWNYSKTPSRGVKEFGILVDDLLVYNGILEMYSPNSNPNCSLVLFSDNKSILEKDVDSISKSIQLQQDLLLLNENKTTNSKYVANPDQSLRPYTSVSPVSPSNTTYVK